MQLKSLFPNPSKSAIFRKVPNISSYFLEIVLLLSVFNKQ
jgi:hypothetical protein